VRNFYEKISQITFGEKLDLNDFKQVIDLIFVICFKEGGGKKHLEKYV
jgi:hypothetical protein